MKIEAYGGVLMKIESAGENSFYILLSDKDMNELGISFEELDYSNIETRRVIWTLLEEARNTLGRDIDPRSKMLIEVSKGDRGCKIEFTLSKSGTGRFKIKKESPFINAFFNDFSNLCAFFEHCRPENILESSEVYKYERGYALLLTAKTGYKTRLRLVISEYAVLLPDSQLFTFSLREHGKLIFRNSSSAQAP